MKSKIIQKATTLFLKLGFKSVTMDDIADEMGISKKTIYLHFKNKTALVKQCTLAVMSHISEGIDAICALDQNPIDEIFAIKKFIMDQLQNEQNSARFQLQKYYPDISKTLQQTRFDKMMECTKKNIRKGMEMGLYRKNLDVEFIARIYYIGITGMGDQRVFPIKSFPTNYITDEYLEYHLRGIVTKEGLLSLNRYIKEKQSDEE